MFTNEEISKNIQKYMDFYNEMRLVVTYAMLGRVTKKLRGVTLNFNGVTVQLEIFLDSEPTEEEAEELSEIETDMICAYPSDKDYRSDFIISVVASNIDISDRRRNWGWIFLRREE